MARAPQCARPPAPLWRVFPHVAAHRHHARYTGFMDCARKLFAQVRYSQFFNVCERRVTLLVLRAELEALLGGFFPPSCALFLPMLQRSLLSIQPWAYWGIPQSKGWDTSFSVFWAEQCSAGSPSQIEIECARRHLLQTLTAHATVYWKLQDPLAPGSAPCVSTISPLCPQTDLPGNTRHS